MTQPIRRLTGPTYHAKLHQCIHCGMCLEACPTYALFGTEMDGPRGRIALMRAAAEGRVAPDAFSGSFATHLNRCLACRACETACPSGVQYGSLIEVARSAIEQERTPGSGERLLRRLGLRQLMPHRGRLRLAARLLRVYQSIGLQKLVRGMNVLPPTLAAMENILPPIATEFVTSGDPAPAGGQQRGRVAFFTGCVQDAFLSPVNAATVRVLQRNGFEVHFPAAQTCCGAAHAHTGEEDQARDLARRNIDAFLDADYDAVINNAGGCGLMLKEVGHLLADDPVYADRARQFATAVQDITQFLADNLHTPPTNPLNLRVTYADSCHLRHGQNVVQPPRRTAAANSRPGTH